jgi:hypothetical protein
MLMPFDHGEWGPTGEWAGPGGWPGGWDQPPFVPGRPPQDPRQLIRYLEPVAQHGLRQLQAGVDPLHVMRQVAAMGYLVGTGYTPYQAIQTVEQWEQMGFLP